MQAATKFISTVPVLSSANIPRDIKWYREKTGFDCDFHNNGYAVLRRETIHLHLQWHAGTGDDPLNGGSVIRVFVENIQPIFLEFVKRGTVSAEQFKSNTPWNTCEFGFFDLNKNALFIVENIRSKHGI